MACPRCQLHPVTTDRNGNVCELVGPLSLVESDPVSDPPLLHPGLSIGAFLAPAQAPTGFELPRLCHVCGGVYYPKVILDPELREIVDR